MTRLLEALFRWVDAIATPIIWTAICAWDDEVAAA